MDTPMVAHALSQKTACLVSTFPFFLSTCSYLKYLPTCLPACLPRSTYYLPFYLFSIAACGLFLKQNIRKERPPIPTSRSWRPFFRESRLPARSLIAAARIASGLGTRRHWFSSFHVGGITSLCTWAKNKTRFHWQASCSILICILGVQSGCIDTSDCPKKFGPSQATFAFQNHSGGRCHRLTSQWISILIEKPRCQNEIGNWS